MKEYKLINNLYPFSFILLRILIISFLNMPMKNSVNFYFDNCSITEIAYDLSNNSLLTKLNATEHLK